MREVLIMVALTLAGCGDEADVDASASAQIVDMAPYVLRSSRNDGFNVTGGTCLGWDGGVKRGEVPR